MKGYTFGAVMVGAAVLMASCTSTSTAVVDSSASASIVAPSSAPVSSAAPSSAPASSVVPSSVAPSSAPASSGSLDGATTAWFTAFCGGLTPVLRAEKDVKTKQPSIGATDYAAQRKLLVDFLTTAGPGVTDIAAKLKALPAPTFNRGVAFAAKVVAAFGKTGPSLTTGGRKLAAVDISKGTSGLSSAAPNLAADLASLGAPITAVGELDIPDSTKAALLMLPACAKLQSTVTG